MVIAGLGSAEGLAVDWVARNLYFVDAGAEMIGVCSLRTGTAFCGSVIDSDLSSPRGIAIHPAERTMFFGQWGTSGKIERAWLDGSERMYPILLMYRNSEIVKQLFLALQSAPSKIRFLHSFSGNVVSVWGTYWSLTKNGEFYGLYGLRQEI